MTPQVFISHASEDKKRLQPYIMRLLTALPGAHLWIDTPEKIHESFGNHPRIRRIISGDDWERSIGYAIDEASCVLVFWSARVIERPRLVLWREVIRAIEDRKCLMVTLDPMGSYDDQTPASTRHKYDVSDLTNAESVAAFEALVFQIKEFIDRQKARASAPQQIISVEGQLLPYLVDRQPQMITICRAVDGMNYEISERSEAASAVKPLLFIVPALSEDAADMFASRLAARDGPQYVNSRAPGGSSAWPETLLQWPTAATGQHFAQWFSDTNGPKIGNGLGKSRRLGLPACFWTMVWQSDIEKSFRSSIEAWISYWNSTITAPTLDPKDEAWLKRQPPVVAILFVILRPAEKGMVRLLSLTKRGVNSLCSELQALAYQAPTDPIETRKTVLRSLSRLTPIRLQEATDWYSGDLPGAPLKLAARAIVRKIFHELGEDGIPLQRFAESINTSEEWTRALSHSVDVNERAS
jgi:hypothetical protein